MSWSTAQRVPARSTATQTLTVLDPFRSVDERAARMSWGTAGVIDVADDLAVRLPRPAAVLVASSSARPRAM